MGEWFKQTKLPISDCPADYIPAGGTPFFGIDFGGDQKTVEVVGFRDADGTLHIQSVRELEDSSDE